MSIRIALDQAVGRRRAEELINMGYHVTVMAKGSETDGSWLNRAFTSGASFAISPDLDIPRLIEKNSYPMVWISYPCDMPEHRGNEVKYIDETIKFKMKFFRDIIGEGGKKKGKSWFTSFLSFIKSSIS